MDFREFVKREEMVGESVFSGALKRGVVAGSLALSALGGLGPAIPGAGINAAMGDEIPLNRDLEERQKDRNRYYSVPSMKKLVKLAHEGDEWAKREVAWPKDHPFHKQGRPFFRNDGPHPDGLFPHSGF